MTTIPVDYEILRLVWWLLLGVLLIGFAIMDGFDLGVAMLLPYVVRCLYERRGATASPLPARNNPYRRRPPGRAPASAAPPARRPTTSSGSGSGAFLGLGHGTS